MERKDVEWKFYILQNVKFKGRKEEFEEELKKWNIKCWGSKKSDTGFLFGIRVKEVIDVAKLKENLADKWNNHGYELKIDEGTARRYQNIGDSWPVS